MDVVRLQVARHGGVARDRPLLRTSVLLLGVALLAAYSEVFLSSSSPSKWLLEGALWSAFGLALLLWTWRAGRASRAAVVETLAAGAPAARNRLLVCYGTPEELAPLADLEPAFVEPVVVAMATRYSVQWLGGAALFLATGAGAMVFGKAGFLCGLTLFASLHLATFLWSGYLRISPQVLELMTSRAWSARTTLGRRVSLERASVVCRYDVGMIGVFPERPDQGAVWIDLRMVREPHLLVRALLRAAATGVVAPALPEERLLG